MMGWQADCLEGLNIKGMVAWYNILFNSLLNQVGFKIYYKMLTLSCAEISL